MGQREVTEKKHPNKEANRITKFLDLGLAGSVRFPVNVKQVALELTPSFNADPITAVRGESFKSIDGALIRHSNKKEWGILYNTEITHPGRVNFTLAHELGHYMVHRHTITSDRIGGRAKFLPLAWAGMPKTSFRKNSDSPPVIPRKTTGLSSARSQI